MVRQFKKVARIIVYPLGPTTVSPSPGSSSIAWEVIDKAAVYIWVCKGDKVELVKEIRTKN